jgi:predicted DNA-binding protein (MmcQ/YjbR family)
MKKFFGNFLLLFLVILVSLVAVPWNNFSQWGFSIPVLASYELVVKAGVGLLVVLIGILYLFISNRQYATYNHVRSRTRNIAVIPLFSYSLASLAYTAYLAYSLYARGTQTSTELIILAGTGALIFILLFLGYIFISEYKFVRNVGRTLRTILLIFFAATTALLSYFHLIYRVGSDYSSISTRYMILMVPLFLVLYILFMIFSSIANKRSEQEESLEQEIDEIKESKYDKSDKKERQVFDTKKGKIQPESNKSDQRKTMIVSKEQTIVSGNDNIDPTNIVFQDVSVDPEFAKMSNQANQANSIEYYIEKPKMFKPLDPTFDELVQYVRELPQVVKKLDYDRITFYLDRKPFLVLMNYGNYYRMAFKYDLEQGIRLIIKYPTISKNKSTKEELWFKANNYGDIPKEVIYNIVKNSYNNYSS